MCLLCKQFKEEKRALRTWPPQWKSRELKILLKGMCSRRIILQKLFRPLRTRHFIPGAEACVPEGRPAMDHARPTSGATCIMAHDDLTTYSRFFPVFPTQT